MRKTSNIAIAIGMIPDLILGDGFDLKDEYDVKKIKDRIVEAVQFEVGLTYGEFSDEKTVNLSDVVVIRQNDDNQEQMDLTIKSSFNHLIMSISEYKKTLETFYMGVVAYFDKLGFDIVMSASVAYMWDQGEDDDIEALGKYDLYLQSEDCQKQIAYVMFRDSSESFTLDEMDEAKEAWGEYLKPEITEDEDDTFKPRSSDDILRDLLGDDDDKDEENS
jgi:hypothetical protein